MPSGCRTAGSGGRDRSACRGTGPHRLSIIQYPHVPAPEEQITLPDQFLGTPDYLAPEQCYELLTGQPPIADAAHRSVFLKMEAHVEAPVPPIRGRRADVPDRLAAALERMLAKDRTDR